jgi:3-methyladenine DNA glycosylase AlkC
VANTLKERVDAATVRRLADAIAAIDPSFDADAFAANAAAGLDALELKARMEHVAIALGRHLAGPFARAADVLCRAAEAASLDVWTAWPLTTWVERRGLEDPPAALDAIERLTRYASGEFAVRPLIEQHPEPTFARLAEWAASDDVHLRRLASEGTRPRLPWGRRLVALQRDPSPALPLLDRLRDDPEEYVRRSVANHLNDVAKDHPALAAATARRWLAEGGVHTERVVRHGLRTLVKAGDPEALALVGAESSADVAVEELRLEETAVRLGESLRFSFLLRNREDRPVPVVVDYVINFRRANGALSPKVFKLANPTLPPVATIHLRRVFPIRPITTRRYYPGEHRLEIQVSGRILASARFELLA